MNHKRKKERKKKCFTILKIKNKKNMDNLYFILDNILIRIFRELTKYRVTINSI